MNLVLKSTKRDIFGRKVKALRKEGLIPANIFGKKVKSHAVTVSKKEFEETFKKAGETQLIDLEGKSVLVSNLQKDPVSGEIIHIDFRQVDLTEKITAHVPVEVDGESPAEKQSLGTVVQQIHELEVESLPADLPEKITVDVSGLVEVNQAIFVRDLKIDKKVEVKTDMESIVVKVEPPQKEEVVETPVETLIDGEATAPTEGESPVAGNEAKEGEKNSDQSA